MNAQATTGNQHNNTNEKGERMHTNADQIAARELYLHAKNDGQLYRKIRQPVEARLTYRREKGNYNSEWAIDAFMHVVDAAAKDYTRMYAASVDKWFELFPKATREATARMFRDDFEVEAAIRERGEA